MADVPTCFSTDASEDWNNTPPAVQALILALWAELAALREPVGKNSRNSSRPPSSDPPSIPKQTREKSGRSPGGQPGPSGTSRTLREVSEVKEVIPLKPSMCQQCGHTLAGDDPAPLRHQVTAIPQVVALDRVPAAHADMLEDARVPLSLRGCRRGHLVPGCKRWSLC